MPTTRASLLPLLITAAMMLGACNAAGQPAEKPAGDGPAPPKQADREQAPAQGQAEALAPPEVSALLDQIEDASAGLTTLKTRVRYTRLQTLTGDEQRRFGDFYYAAGDGQTPTRFAVLFDRLVIDERARPMKTWFIFDGNWLLERDHDDKTAVRRELVPEGAEQSDMLNMGEGQVPIPLKLKADQVLKEYKVEKLEDVPFGDQTLHHLRLTPRKGGKDAAPVELWFDSETLLLQKIVTDEEGDEIEMLFPTPKLNPEIEDGVFKTELPDKKDGWQVQEVPIED